MVCADPEDIFHIPVKHGGKGQETELKDGRMGERRRRLQFCCPTVGPRMLLEDGFHDE